MFCSGCGLPVTPGMSFCPQCSRPVAAPIPTMPGMEFQIQNYAGKVRSLGVVWFIYAGWSLLSGILGLAFAQAFFAGRFGFFAHGPFVNGPWGNPFFGHFMLHSIWAFLIVRSALALAAGWGLMERTEWGRPVALVAAFFSILKFPFGTAIAIWTFVVLMGYRNSTLYNQL
jgi:hypothetical protein